MKTVLKYPGSKWNIAGQLVNMIPEHHSYVEPFFGSGAVLFNKNVSDIETVNDLDSDVTNLFRCIQKDSERLARLVMTTPFSREEYDKQFETACMIISQKSNMNAKKMTVLEFYSTLNNLSKQAEAEAKAYKKVRR